MGMDSKIGWTHHTFNPVWGCQKVSPGCKNCYAETLSKRFGSNIWGPDSERRTFGDKHWNEPRRWNKRAEKEGNRQRVFCGSMCDIYEYHSITNQARHRLFDLIRETPWLDWLLLTKRPENIQTLGPAKLPGNVWIGTSVEDQARADERIPILLKVPAAIRFISVEPLLGPVSLRKWINQIDNDLHWVIVGGESGPGARHADVVWAMDLLTECMESGVRFFMKQMGGHPDKRAKMSQFPGPLRRQEFPESKFSAPHLTRPEPQGTFQF